MTSTSQSLFYFTFIFESIHPRVLCNASADVREFHVDEGAKSKVPGKHRVVLKSGGVDVDLSKELRCICIVSCNKENGAAMFIEGTHVAFISVQGVPRRRHVLNFAA